MARQPINLNNKVQRLGDWIFPSVLIAISPVLAQFIVTAFQHGFEIYSVENLIAYISPKGELLLIAVALVADSMSEMLPRRIHKNHKNAIVALCWGFGIIATYVFASISTGFTQPLLVSTTSVEFFILGLLLCIWCKIAGRS